MVHWPGYHWVTGVGELGESPSESGASESIAFPEFALGVGMVEKDERAEGGRECHIAGTRCPVLPHYVCREPHSVCYTYRTGDCSLPLRHHVLFLPGVHPLSHHSHHPCRLYAIHHQWSQASVYASNASSKMINGRNL